MGYLGNNLATVVCGTFASVLTGWWFVMPDLFNFIFMMAVPIMWFITFMCWMVQKAQDYTHKSSVRNVKKMYTPEGKKVPDN